MKVCPACSKEYPADRTNCERDGVALVALVTGAGAKAEDLIGRTVDGRYLVEAIIGKGGMGMVYQCRHVVVGKPFAMKVIHAGTDQTEGVLQRFIREAQTANSIRSRHIVEMTDFGQLPSGQFYVTMDLLQGMDLGKALKRGLTRDQLFHVFIQAADALEQTHQRGVVHRDLKPDNIFLVTEDNDPLFVKLLDFGIAKAMHSGPSGLTETGVVLGTPYYMSPEQARGEECDHRTDIYSLGVIMYRAFTGKLPFTADSAIGVLTRHLTERPDPPSQVAGLDPNTERVILCCLEKKRNDRFPTMRALADAMRAIRAGAQPSFGAPQPAPSYSGANPAVSGSNPAVSGANLAISGGNPAISGVNPAISGAVPHAAPSWSGANPAMQGPPSQSGAVPVVGAQGPARSGAMPAMQSAQFAYAPTAYAPAQTGQQPITGGQPQMQGVPGQPGAQMPSGPEWTSHGLAASQQMRVAQPRAKWPLIVGAVAMIGLGAALAVTLGLFGSKGADGTGAAMGATSTATATAAPSASATEAPTASASGAASADPSGVASVPTAKASGPRTGGGAAAKPTASATATATSTKRGAPEIRSPFD